MAIYNYEAPEDQQFKAINFTISGFSKPEFEAVKNSQCLENRMNSFQKEIFAKPEKSKKNEVETAEMNIIERLMFNVQTSDLIEESK